MMIARSMFANLYYNGDWHKALIVSYVDNPENPWIDDDDFPWNSWLCQWYEGADVVEETLRIHTDTKDLARLIVTCRKAGMAIAEIR